MRFIRNLIIGINLFIILVCIILLLNFTAPNPTGRRYSSRPVNLAMSSSAIGQEGESILANDLHVERNEDRARKCICNTGIESPPGRCGECKISLPLLDSNFRIPDFFTPKFIAEVKNQTGLRHKRDCEELSDYVLASQRLKLPLWIYVRVDTIIEPQFIELVASGGGQFVYYLAVPGYVDPVDRIATFGLAGASTLLGVIGGTTLLLKRRKRSVKTLVTTKPRPRPGTPIDFAEEFLSRTKQQARQKIEAEDSRLDES